MHVRINNLLRLARKDFRSPSDHVQIGKFEFIPNSLRAENVTQAATVSREAMLLQVYQKIKM